MLQTILNALPFGSNMKVFLGTSLLLGISYWPLYTKKQDAVSYETMADKRASLKKKAEDAARAKAAAAQQQ